MKVKEFFLAILILLEISIIFLLDAITFGKSKTIKKWGDSLDQKLGVDYQGEME